MHVQTFFLLIRCFAFKSCEYISRAILQRKRLDTLFLLYQTYAFDMVPTAGLEPATY